MTGTGTFADIIRAVTDIWGLLALALLLIGLLAIQLTKGAHPNLRLATFLVIFAGFLGCLYMGFARQPSEAAPGGDAATAAHPNTEDVAAQVGAATEYRESVDAAYSNAAAEMDSIASRIAGEEPADDSAKPSGN
jgi:hypothetical protein